MVRKVFKKKRTNSKIDAFVEKYKIPREFLSVNRKSVTKALLVGIFIAFIPMPFQMLAVLAVSPFIRFNIPIAISMVWLSNPITMPPMYYMEYLTGTWLLGMEPLHDVQMTMEWFQSHLDDIFIPLYVGTFFYSVTVSVAVYALVNWLWVRSVNRERKAKKGF
ncbi:hypothetical protein NNO_1703 [Hydrogenimonas sp.]|nr:hypothetical protein NNO_1703 [Hydrogenimonas sp.]